MLDDIMLFIRLVECGSFKKTAHLMSLQQSTISKHIANLEYKLGKRLLIRDSRNISITEAGKFMYERFKHLDSYVSSTIDNLTKKAASSNLGGVLTVSLASILSFELICPYVQLFTQHYPEIKLNLIFQSDDIDWDTANINLALTTGSVKGTNLDNRFVRTETSRLYCRMEYVSKYGIPQTPDELHQHNCIGALDAKNQPIDYVSFFNTKSKQEYLLDSTKIGLKVNTFLHAKRIGLSADYIFGCWETLCLKDVECGLLVPVLPDWETYRLNFYLVSKKAVTATEQKFIDFIHSCMGHLSVS